MSIIVRVCRDVSSIIYTEFAELAANAFGEKRAMKDCDTNPASLG